jgi:hypothetical protein
MHTGILLLQNVFFFDLIILHLNFRFHRRFGDEQETGVLSDVGLGRETSLHLVNSIWV